MEENICKKCGLVNDYKTEMKSGQNVATCNGCGRYIKNISYAEPTLYFGKYSQTKITDITDLGYLEWAVKNIKKLTPKLKDAMEKQIEKLKNKSTRI